MHGPLSRAGEFYNYVEVGLWPAMGLIVAAVALRKSGPARRDGLIAAVIFVAFGASDWFENETGGEWWHPWWLLLWKAACVAVLLAFGFRSRRRSAVGARLVSPPAAIDEGDTSVAPTGDGASNR